MKICCAGLNAKKGVSVMVLKINNVSKQFGGIKALTDVSFDISEGEILGIIGPNGAGKTTMFNMITSFYMPTSGVIEFQVDKISGMKPHQIITRDVCRAFQKIQLLTQLTA